jgi:hypothetical protein
VEDLTSSTKSSTRAAAPAASIERPQDRHHYLVEQLISRLPDRPQVAFRWLRRPSSRWARIPAGVLLVGGGFLSILPLFGRSLLPLGLLLLAEDMPPLKRARNRILEHIQQRRPHWFPTDEALQSLDPASRPEASSDIYR